MKQFIVIIWLLFSFSVSAQNWTSVKETNVWVGSALNFGVDIYTNRYGNHIIVQRPNVLKYFKMNVNGTATDSVVIESSSVISPSITGDNEKVYIIYRKTNENFIRTKYLTNGGTNIQSLSNLNIGSANRIESIMSNNRLHVTYEVSNNIKYSLYYSGTWSQELTVSSGENGIWPRITAWHDANDDKVYFMYLRYNSSNIKWREYNVATSSWVTTPQLAIAHVGSMPAGLAVGDSRISFYYTYFSTPYYYFQWIVKNKSNNSTICTFSADINSTSFYLYSTKTYDGNVHVPLWLNFAGSEEDEPAIYQSNGTDCNWELIYWNINQLAQNVHFINGSSSSNDVYVILQDDSIGPNLRLIYDDQNPLVPQDLAVEIYTEGSETYPKLTWSLNNEPDVFIKINAYQVWRRYRLNGGPWSGWYIIGYSDGDESEYIDYTISGLYAEAHTAEYKLRVRDYYNRFSDFSSTVSINFSKLGKISNSILTYDYELGQNYPNPFNPTTQIDYSNKSAGMVTLKVYDMLGTEVATLVNERKEPGNYTATFNAANLPSGIYVYTLTSGSFYQTRKLILLK